MGECLEENAVVEFVQGELDADAAASVEAHLDACERCSALVAELARVYDDIAPPSDAPLTLTSEEPGEHPEVRLARGATVGRYIVVERIGAGAMGFVYAAYDPELDRRVALKLLRERALGESQRTRLLREAQAAARLTHPNVIVVHDVGEYEGAVFITMEYVEGGTLGEWVVADKPSQREIVATYSAAARGLAAAHKAGLVHRDFKPANVLVGDGIVRVTDFGLARPSTESLHTAPIAAQGSLMSSPAMFESLTRTGALVGTPAYMSPEQFEGRPADARSDQFSFCIALYEALVGTRPFAGKSLAELSSAVCEGRLHDPNALAALPRRLRRALARGLSADPKDRFGSMDALLAALRPGRSRRVWPLLGAAAIAGAAATVLAGEDTPCDRGAKKIDEVWNDARRDEVASAFRATTLPYKESALLSAQATLDEFAQTWQAIYIDACEAHRSGEQSAELLDLRMICLDARREGLEVVVEVLREGGPTTVENAAAVASALPDFAKCSDTEWLRETVPRPAPEIAVQERELRQQMRDAHARSMLGHAKEAVDAARKTYDAAQEIDYAPLRARAAWMLAEIQREADPGTDNEALYIDALGWALAGHDDRGAAGTAIFLLQSYNDAEKARSPQARHWTRLAEGLVARVPDPKLEGELRHTKAMLARQRGELEEARRLAELDLEQSRAKVPDRVPVALNTLASIVFLAGDYRHARALYGEALEIDREKNGEMHPTTAISQQNLAAAMMASDDDAAALPLLEAALATREALYGVEAPQLLTVLQNLGTVLPRLGRVEDATRPMERALAIAVKTFGPTHPRTADARLQLGATYYNIGRNDEAHAAYEQGLADLQSRLPEDAIAVLMAKYNLAESKLQNGDVGSARTLAEASHAGIEKTHPAGHPYLGYSLTLLGRVALAEGKSKQAADHLEAALAVRTKAQTTALERAETQVYLATALRELDATRSAALYDEARPTVTAALSPGADRLRALLP